MAREDDDQRAARRERHLRRLGSRHPRCQRCGETEPAALAATDGEVVCYECTAAASGRPVVEQHHIAGRHNDPTTAPLPGNAHRLVSDEQRAWPEETLRNPDGSPLLTEAAWDRGSLDVLRLICDHVSPRAVILEDLDRKLTDLLGPRWWEQLASGDGDGRDS
jgi:hypothetical protein